jgi:L-lysine exporter family protein LysE/ArgO
MHTVISLWAMGLGTGFGLIVAIGAQNAFLLRLGITGPARATLGCIAVCALSDIVLIAAGVAGVGVIVQRLPALLVVFRIVGLLFLTGYGLLAARRAFRPSTMAIEDQPGPGAGAQVPERERVTAGVATAGAAPQHRAGHSPAQWRPAGRRRTAPAGTVRSALLTCLAFTWLNPHVYIDTVVFLGSLANQQSPGLRWWWAAGAMSASAIWFTSLGLGARFLRPVFARPSAWRVLDAAIAVIMIAFAVRLASGL